MTDATRSHSSRSSESTLVHVCVSARHHEGVAAHPGQPDPCRCKTDRAHACSAEDVEDDLPAEALDEGRRHEQARQAAHLQPAEDEADRPRPLLLRRAKPLAAASLLRYVYHSLLAHHSNGNK